MRVFSEKNFDKLSEEYDKLFKENIEAFAEAQRQSKTNHAEKSIQFFTLPSVLKRKIANF